VQLSHKNIDKNSPVHERVGEVIAVQLHIRSNMLIKPAMGLVPGSTSRTDRFGPSFKPMIARSSGVRESNFLH